MQFKVKPTFDSTRNKNTGLSLYGHIQPLGSTSKSCYCRPQAPLKTMNCWLDDRGSITRRGTNFYFATTSRPSWAHSLSCLTGCWAVFLHRSLKPIIHLQKVPRRGICGGLPPSHYGVSYIIRRSLNIIGVIKSRRMRGQLTQYG